MKFYTEFCAASRMEEMTTSNNCWVQKLHLAPDTCILIQFAAWRDTGELFSMKVDVLLPYLGEDVMKKMQTEIHRLAVDMLSVDFDYLHFSFPDCLNIFSVHSRAKSGSAYHFHRFANALVLYFGDFGTQNPEKEIK